MTRLHQQAVTSLLSILLAACSGAVATQSPSPTAQLPSPMPTVGPSAAATVAPSPTAIPILDGEPWIAYAWWIDGGDEELDMLLVRPDGSDAHEIAADLPGEHGSPDWSPDGRRLAFVVRGDATSTPNGGIFLADADGTNVVPLFDNTRRCPDGAGSPAWSPDGTRMSITCYGDGAATVQVVDLATLEMTQIASVHEPEFIDSPASWSPDGRYLAFDILQWALTDEHATGSLIAVAPSAGGDVQRLTAFDSFAAAPAWHPTDALIAFNSYDLSSIKLVPEPTGVFTIHPDGTGLRTVVTMPDTFARLARLRWLPDGTSFIANLAHGNPVGSAEIVMVSAVDGTWRSLATPAMGSTPRLRPTP